MRRPNLLIRPTFLMVGGAVDAGPGNRGRLVLKLGMADLYRQTLWQVLALPRDPGSRQTGLAAPLLELEVTEGALMENSTFSRPVRAERIPGLLSKHWVLDGARAAGELACQRLPEVSQE